MTHPYSAETIVALISPLWLVRTIEILNISVDDYGIDVTGHCDKGQID
jgi:hypothetical protein